MPIAARQLWARRAFGALLLAAAASGGASCEPKLVVGKYNVTCEPPPRIGAPPSEGGAGGEMAVGRPRPTEPLPVTFSTGFENEFCDYAAAQGYCYVVASAAYETVTSPVHSGNHSAAYTIASADGLRGNQSRCVLGGELPVRASYGAYFFVPEAPTAVNNWNLIHFRGFDSNGSHGLWDVSLNLQPDGSLRVYVFDHLRMQVRMSTRVPPVPVAEWFKLEVTLQRAADETGSITVTQDDQVAVELTDLLTDDSTYGEWYLGNLATSITPSDSTIYVDDVFLREAP